MYEFKSKLFFLSKHFNFFFGRGGGRGHFRFRYIHFPLADMLYLGAHIRLELSCIWVNMVLINTRIVKLAFGVLCQKTFCFILSPVVPLSEALCHQSMNLPLNYSLVPTVISLLFTIFDIPSINLYRHQSKGFLYFTLLAKISHFSTPKCPSFLIFVSLHL